MAYESPKVTELGSVAALTRGEGIPGDADDLYIFGYDTGIDFGTS